jgi:hypothetical protein
MYRVYRICTDLCKREGNNKMPSANEIMAGFKSRNATPKKRTNWKKELELERGRVIDEAIERIRAKLRSENLPESYKRGHYAAITELELMKDDR